MTRRRNKPRRLAPLSTPLEIRKCLHCGNEFMPNRTWQKYCRQEHSFAAYVQRKYGAAADAPPANATPRIISKIDEMPDLVFQDEQTEAADKAADLLKNVPTGQPMPATKALENLGYGIPELDEEDEK